MHRARLLPALLLCGGLLAACADANPPSPVPGSPTPLALAPQTMLLRPNQMRAYVRTDDSTVDAGKLADQESDQSLVKTLGDEGLQMGARATYADPNNGGPPTPFATVISQVLEFRDALGAAHFVADEQVRRSKAPTGGSLATLELPKGGADTIWGLAASVPASAQGDPPARALFALIRRGNIVAELLGGGTAATASNADFTALVNLQEQQLQQTVASS